MISRVEQEQRLYPDRAQLTPTKSYISQAIVRGSLLAIVLAGHAAVIPWFMVGHKAPAAALPVVSTWIVGAKATSSHKPQPEALMPTIAVAYVLIDPAEVISQLPPLTIRLPAEPNAAAVSVAPQWDDSSAVDVTPYAQAAGLLPGEGATVVLRIEVLPGGAIGRVAVDISSGSAWVDAQAVGFARAQRWISGTADGASQSMWIRWGVRLEVPAAAAARLQQQSAIHVRRRVDLSRENMNA